MRYRELLKQMRSEQYVAATALEKRDTLWALIEESRYATLPPVEYSVIRNTFRILNLRLLTQAFRRTEDVRPPRTKAFHPYGTIAMIRFVPEGQHPYTGMFATGFVGLARLSLAMDVTRYGPSTAIKLLVDGQRSQSILMDQALDPQASRDFFERSPTNVTLTPSSFPIGTFWWLINWWLSFVADPLYQPLDQVAAVTSTGKTVTSPHAPYQILLFTPPELHFLPDTTEDFRIALGRIPAGTLLYRVFARGTRDETDKLYIGSVLTESEFVASDFGDRVLSIPHTRQRTGAS
jgi:hypothetical protein